MSKLANWVTLTLKLASICFVTVVFASPASADDWGGWRYKGAAGTGDCLYAGTRIYTSATPDIHTVSAANSCSSSYVVTSDAEAFNLSGTEIGSCTNTATNHSQCKVQVGGPNVWIWDAVIYSGGSSYSIYYSQKYDGTDPYDLYWTSTD